MLAGPWVALKVPVPTQSAGRLEQLSGREADGGGWTGPRPPTSKKELKWLFRLAYNLLTLKQLKPRMVRGGEEVG